MKRCGKSAPPAWRHDGQGKPHTEQDQIGERSRLARLKLPGRLLDLAGNRQARGMTATCARESGRRNRIRLIGPLPGHLLST